MTMGTILRTFHWVAVRVRSFSIAVESQNRRLSQYNYSAGDCDRDSHCAEGLVCFQRNGDEEVPGCLLGAGAVSGKDYCVSENATVLPPTLSPVSTPPSSTETCEGELRYVYDNGENPESLPLGCCEGMLC